MVATAAIAAIVGIAMGAGGARIRTIALMFKRLVRVGGGCGEKGGIRRGCKILFSFRVLWWWVYIPARVWDLDVSWNEDGRKNLMRLLISGLRRYDSLFGWVF